MPQDFALNPAAYGLPTRDDLVKFRIWDIHYHGFFKGGIPAHEENLFYVERMGIERMLSLDIAGTPTDPLGNKISVEEKREIRAHLEKHADRVSGLIPIDPGEPVESCRKMEEWIGKGPCIGIKYYGGNPLGVLCSHPNNDAIIRLAGELKAVIYIHTWLQVGGEPRRPGGKNQPGEATPLDVAKLAARFPNVNFICGHSGGDWERRPLRPAAGKRLHRVQRLRPALGAGRFHRCRSGRQPPHLGRARPVAVVFDGAGQSPRRRPDPRPAAFNLRRQPAATGRADLPGEGA